MNIELAIGDITEQSDCDAIVNAANPMLMRGAGVAGVIHKKAGPALERYCESYAPINVSEAIITPGFKLHNKFIVHVVGPKYYQDPNPEELLRCGYRNILQKCTENKIKKIAIPAISTGSYGFPIKEAIHIALVTISDWDDNYPELGRVVLYDRNSYDVALHIFNNLR